MANESILSQEEFDAISKKAKNFSDYLRLLADAEAAKKRETAQKAYDEKHGDDYWNQFAQIGMSNQRDAQGNELTGSAAERSVYGDAASPSEDLYGRQVAQAILEQLDAGLDPYSDPRVQNLIQYATSRGWRLPDAGGLIDYDRFVNDYQDQQYIQGLQDGRNGTYQGWNFGFDPDNLPQGVDAATAARMQLAPLLQAQEEQPHGPDNWNDLQNGWHYDSDGNWVEGIPWDARYDAIMARTREQNGIMSLADALARQRERQNALPAVERPVQTAARNGTPGLLSDEYEDINTRTEGIGQIGAQFNEAGQEYLDQNRARLANALGAGQTGTGYQDYLSALSSQGLTPTSGGTASGGTATPTGSSGYSAPRRANTGLDANGQRDAYRSMLDALVRGSNGGKATSAGFGAANKIYEQIGEITDPKPIYQKYGNYSGNTLTRDKDYNYLNKLLGQKG